VGGLDTHPQGTTAAAAAVWYLQVLEAAMTEAMTAAADAHTAELRSKLYIPQIGQPANITIAD
jgi:ribulose 1,5-bisphosphate carboxylase large subunit-like protein